jgi:6-phosphogluconolactonase
MADVGRTGATEIRIFDDAAELARVAAEAFLRKAVSAIDVNGRFTVALSGGSTPKRLFEILATEPFSSRVPWQHVHVFWGDERSVPPDHPDSNYGAADESLLSRVDLPAANVHRIKAEVSDPAEAAAGYEAELRSFFELAEGQIPRFDLAFLGVGPDGHTASLFPGTEALGERRRLVVANWVEILGAYRITLTCPVFDKAACIVFMVAGADKADTLQQVLEGPPDRYPAQSVRPEHGELIWYVDKAAAAALGRTGSD